MKIGELAKKTGLSVRMLHHYDEIGLLKPSDRTDSGHRVYGNDDICRLQKIVSLRDLGLSLEEVRNTLGDPAISVLSIIERHAYAVEEDLVQRKNLLSRLKSITSMLKAETAINLEIILATIRDVVSYEKFLSREQIEDIWQRKKQMGKERFQEIATEVTELIPLVKAEMDKKTDPSSENVKSLALRWKKLSDLITGGKENLQKSLRNIYDQPGYENRYGVSREMLEYIRASLAAIQSNS